MQQLVWAQLNQRQQQQALARAECVSDASLVDAVADIVAQVKNNGDNALAALSAKFDGGLPSQWLFNADQFAAIGEQTELTLKQAIDVALDNIDCFHRAQQQQPLSLDVQAGIRCELRTEAIERVGLYVPGGTAPLISTVLMLAKPAQIAGCQQTVLVTPPPLHPAMAYAAAKCNVDMIATIGGAQAVAALAFGTDSIPKVDKIYGPGSRFVTEAKQQVSQQGVAIDMPAGPSEVLVLADGSANARFIAADLLSQAEHGEDSQALLVTDSAELAAAVAAEVAVQLPALSRVETATAALAQSRIIITETMEQAVAVSNAYGPEHLIIQSEYPRKLLPSVRAAGSVFVGPWSPESVGDYASGTNHVLPTYGASRTVSSLSLADFQRRFTVQELTHSGLSSLADTVMTLANAEGLDAHANAVAVRMETIQ
ncbi:histidinol dehydrogenase [Ferrimonas lipolytica]|uniref:Histidinol dehydrogenase n=1 Tax=Ferrimonas lipolytica TaxID=2724191 RepID=A0A6H1UDS9_9GAMM|nr:histidinol dehydrogenase [Ferrimonas lipolytica]QIZ76750.1 histidinol dehydrogenase [Ferrimonas lipolytica]